MCAHKTTHIISPQETEAHRRAIVEHICHDRIEQITTALKELWTDVNNVLQTNIPQESNGVYAISTVSLKTGKYESALGRHPWRLTDVPCIEYGCGVRITFIRSHLKHVLGSIEQELKYAKEIGWTINVFKESEYRTHCEFSTFVIELSSTLGGTLRSYIP